MWRTFRTMFYSTLLGIAQPRSQQLDPYWQLRYILQIKVATKPIRQCVFSLPSMNPPKALIKQQSVGLHTTITSSCYKQSDNIRHKLWVHPQQPLYSLLVPIVSLFHSPTTYPPPGKLKYTVTKLPSMSLVGQTDIQVPRTSSNLTPTGQIDL